MMLQTKWSDEDEWKNHRELADGEDPDKAIALAREDWAATKAKYQLKYDCELRVQMICPKCKAWSGPAEFSCYNCGTSFVPFNIALLIGGIVAGFSIVAILAITFIVHMFTYAN